MTGRRFGVIGVALLLAGLVAPTTGKADGKDKGGAPAVHDATVEFAMPQPQPAGAGTPGTPANSSTHFLLPDDVTITKGGTVTFVVNGGGHGIAIHAVSKNTTREDIAEDLCQGGANEADRVGRNAVCNGTIITPNVDVNGVPTTITGTDNLNYTITDGKGDPVIVTGFNLTAANSAPATIIANPRVDDPITTVRVLATSGFAPGDVGNPAAISGNKAGAFLTGTAAPATPGLRIQVQFNKNGRYLVICMNRSHALNDHMFGFVSVVGGDEQEQ